MLIGGAMILLPFAGCQSPEPGTSAQNSPKTNFGPPMQDVRTEAKIVEMENEYIAAKNSQPTHQAEAEAEAEAARKKQEQEKQAKTKAAQDAAKPNPEPAK